MAKNLAIVPLTMKWFNKTAQGFSPGNCRDKPRPEPRKLSGEQGGRIGGLCYYDAAIAAWLAEFLADYLPLHLRPRRDRDRSV